MDPWHYETSEQLDKSIVERLRQFPREPDILVFGLRSAAAVILRAWMRVYHRLTIAGRENLPRDGSFVIVANHASHLDTPAILSALPLRKLHRVFPAAAKEYFFDTAPRTALAAIVVNALPFDRYGNVRQSLTLCRALLDNPGNVLLIYPEGTRSTTGEIGKFRPGISLLLAGRDLPVVPCYLDGAFRAWPKGAAIPRPYKLRLMIGQPRRYTALRRGKETAETICRDLRDAVLELATKKP
jgi:1-acyl-sn-glycerol-3-phosphate acyltransferase